MKKMWTDEKVRPITIIKLAGLLIITVSIIAFFWGRFMELMGYLESKNIWDIIIYFLLSTLISFPISQFVEKLPLSLYKNNPNITLKMARFIFVILDFFAMQIGLLLIDIIMSTISTHIIFNIQMAFVFSLLYINDIE